MPQNMRGLLEQYVIYMKEIYGSHLRQVILYGSYARGEATENSDIDLLIDTSGTNLRSLFSLGKLYCDLESALEKKIDLITLSSLEQTTRLPSDELFRNNIEKEKVKLYDVA